jgi:hypothetical protein
MSSSTSISATTHQETTCLNTWIIKQGATNTSCLNQGAGCKKRSVSFSHRTVDIWNSLPEEVASATSINSFKNKLDKHWMFAVFKYNYKVKFDLNACTHAHDTISSVEDPAKSGQ